MHNFFEYYHLNSCFGKDNWFTYPQVYTWFANIIPNNGLFVEIGSWTGRSACFLGGEMIKLNKQFKIECIDLWPDDINTLPFNTNIKDRFVNGELYKIFLSNTKPFEQNISHKRSSSYDASFYYENNSIDILFIDGNHSYDGVKSDIENYIKKIKKNGIISGHDYSSKWPGVVRAVNEKFGKDILVKQGCWIKKL